MNYFVAAAILKAFSFNGTTRSLYSYLTTMRRPTKPVYHERSVWVLNALPACKGKKTRALELGTGWVHAYSLYPVLLRDIEMHCFDVQDIRYPFEYFKQAVVRAGEQLGKWGLLTPDELDRVRERVNRVLAARAYDEAYRLLGMTYHVSADGLPKLNSDSIDLIYSIDVLEHVLASAFPANAKRWFELLRPGGRLIAQVGLDDHIAFHDPKLGFGTKRYAHFSERMWTYLLNNDVQYINRIPASEMLKLFEDAGFVIEEDERQFSKETREQMHPDYQWQSDEDFRTFRLTMSALKSPF